MGWGLWVVIIGDSNFVVAADDEVVNRLSCGAGGQKRHMDWSWTSIGESVKSEIHDCCASWHHKARFCSSI